MLTRRWRLFSLEIKISSEIWTRLEGKVGRSATVVTQTLRLSQLGFLSSLRNLIMTQQQYRCTGKPASLDRSKMGVKLQIISVVHHDIMAENAIQSTLDTGIPFQRRVPATAKCWILGTTPVQNRNLTILSFPTH